MTATVTIEERDIELLDRIEDALQAGLTEAKAINLFASFSVEDYDRMIQLFDSELESGLDDTTRDKVIKVLKKIREKKSNA